MTIGSVTHVPNDNKELVRCVHRLARLGVQLKDSRKGGFMVNHNSESFLVVEVKSRTHLDPQLMELKKLVLIKLCESFSQLGDGVL